MSVIGIVNQKGGTGKTTTAVHLAVWLARQESSVLLIDADAQQSSSLWLDKLEDVRIPCQAILDPELLFETLEEVASQYNTIVVDGPGSLSEVTKAILGRSDIALIPCQPSGLDVSSSLKILRIIGHIQKMRVNLPSVGIFLNRAVKNTIQLREAVKFLKQQPYQLLDTIIYQRQCLSDPPATAFDLKETSAKTTVRDYDRLFREVMTLGKAR